MMEESTQNTIAYTNVSLAVISIVPAFEIIVEEKFL